ncbi:hypothetical protein MTX78_03710 [Hymenobacter tibetensis]|uniref:Uncharacterized protein n=1 Tax=Hymenobacter tibetensis TaxID=497967 RepID=A0ABY4D051_9BACT|nr:hypothetical protein [Hymenobacter tibetensis]UOG75706.1 hypothetical protein MTX78_03710 [Hymenobacter tibetensis]
MPDFIPVQAMKTAAFLLKLLFSVLMLTTVALLVSEIAQARHSVARPDFAHPNTTAPSVYSYVRHTRE